MKVVGIIQARMGSERLPGKSMMYIGEKPLIEHVIERVKLCKTINTIVLAVTDKEEDKILVEIANKHNIEHITGVTGDVLDEFDRASKKYRADIVVRICADNPFIDQCEIDKLVHYHIEKDADYSSNNRVHSNSLPDGSGAEVVKADVLMKINKVVNKNYYKEHVTTYIYDNPSMFHVERLDAESELVGPQYRLDIDFQEDLDFIREIYKRLYKKGELIRTIDIIKLLDSNPDLCKMRKER